MSDDGSSDGDFQDQQHAGTNLDLATQEFLEETRATRVLQMKPNAAGEYSLTVMDFVEYLGIELELEPELTWVRQPDKKRNPVLVIPILRGYSS